MAIRPRFRLSTILFTLTLCAVLLGWWRDRQAWKRELQESRREIDSLQLEFYRAKVKAIRFDLNQVRRNSDPRHTHRVLQTVDKLESELEKYTSLIAKIYRDNAVYGPRDEARFRPYRGSSVWPPE